MRCFTATTHLFLLPRPLFSCFLPLPAGCVCRRVVEMAAKVLLVLTGVLMVALLLVSFDVPAAAAAGAEEHQPVTEKAAAVGGVGESKQRHCRCCRWYGGRCQRYCCYNGEEFDVDVETGAVGGVGESKKHCRCCGGWYYGRCKRYCCYNGEVFNVDVGAETEPHN